LIYGKKNKIVKVKITITNRILNVKRKRRDLSAIKPNIGLDRKIKNGRIVFENEISVFESPRERRVKLNIGNITPNAEKNKK
jgi:hypothetical protein